MINGTRNSRIPFIGDGTLAYAGRTSGVTRRVPDVMCDRILGRRSSDWTGA